MAHPHRAGWRSHSVGRRLVFLLCCVNLKGSGGSEWQLPESFLMKALLSPGDWCLLGSSKGDGQGQKRLR